MRETVPSGFGFRKSLCSVLSVTIIGAVGATSDFNNHHDASQCSPYLYSEIQSVDFDIMYEDGDDSSSAIADETRRNPLDNGETQDQRQAPYDNTSPSFDFSVSDGDAEYYEDPSSSVSIMASSVLYDGDCDVSVEAMMCHGGGLDQMMDRFIDYDELFEYDDEDATDDDDDDDNDGHSSMLSNASLRRSKSTRTEKTRRYAVSRSTKSNTKHTTYVNNKVIRLDNTLRLQLQHLPNQDRRQEQQQNQLHPSFLVQQQRIPVPFLRDQTKKTHFCRSDEPRTIFVLC